MSQGNKSAGRPWRSVNASEPCPICERPDWCRRSTDGRLIACRRVEQGAIRSKLDKSGGPCYLHRVDGANVVESRPRQRLPVTAAVERAKADLLDRAYGLLLDGLALSTEHRQQLLACGLNDEQITRGMYRTLPKQGRRQLALALMNELADDYLSVPGFLRDKVTGPAGLLIPCRDSQGRIVALKVRRDEVQHGPRYVYLSSVKHGGPGPGAPVHLPLGVSFPVERVRLTEGELKADIAGALSGLATLSVPGVTNWRPALKVLPALGAKVVRLAFDADALTNGNVARSLHDCAGALQAAGFSVELERWAAADGKGIDDLLAAGKLPEVLHGAEARSAIELLAVSAGVAPAGAITSTTITLPNLGELTLIIEPLSGNKPQRSVVARLGTVEHSDRFDIASAVSRTRFIGKLAMKTKLDEPTLYLAVDNELVKLAERVDHQATSEAGAIGLLGDEKTNQATMVAELLADCTLFHTPAPEAFAQIPIGEHREVWAVKSSMFRGWLNKRFYEQHRKVPNSESIAAGLSLIEAQAIHDGVECPVLVRVAEHDGRIYLDLTNAAWQVVEVSTDGWRVLDESPVMFRRSKGMLPLATPVTGGSIDELQPLLNVDAQTWPLVVGWLLGCLRPMGPFPIMALFAEQGSGKSTAGEMLRAIIDPNKAPLRAEPREERDLMIAATNAWLMAYDNLSHVPSWLSDALCRLSTGGGFATRELFTNGDEMIFDAMRPILLTSIEEVASRSDLLDRCLIVWLANIDTARRKAKSALWKEFERIRPRVLGALLDAAVVGLRNIATTAIDKLPRMADFCLWVTACESSLNWPSGAFVAAYQGNLDAANDLALESSIVAKVLMEHLDERGRWNGQTADLLRELNQRVDEPTKRQRGWPANAKALSGIVKRLAPNLRAAGWDAQYNRTSSRRCWAFDKVGNHASLASFASPNRRNAPRNDDRDAHDASSGVVSGTVERTADEWEEGSL